MITLISIALTWYATKLYYTHIPNIDIFHSEGTDIQKAICFKCGRPSMIHEDHMRTPFYCETCK
jgi:hypothetical protein